MGETENYRAEYSHLVPGDEPGTYKWETLSTQDADQVNSLLDSVASLFNAPFSFLNDFPYDLSQPAWVDVIDFENEDLDADAPVTNEVDLRKVMQQRMKPAMKDCMKSKQMASRQMGNRDTSSNRGWMKAVPVDSAGTWKAEPEPAKASPHASSGLACIVFALGFLTLAAVGLVSVVNCFLSYCCGSCRGSRENDDMLEPLMDRQFLVEGVAEAPHVHSSMPSSNTTKPTLVNVVTYEPLKPFN